MEHNINPENFPSNSHKQKSSLDRDKVKKVVKGNIKKQKKSLGKRFLNNLKDDDAKNIGEYILEDVLIPATKDMVFDSIKTVFDILKSTAEIMIFGEKTGRSYRSSSRNVPQGPKISYNTYFDSRSKPTTRTISRSARSRHSFDEILFDVREDANEVLESLIARVYEFGEATVADFYDFVGVTPSFTDDKYGWTELTTANAKVIRVSGGYVIKLPDTVLLD